MCFLRKIILAEGFFVVFFFCNLKNQSGLAYYHKDLPGGFTVMKKMLILGGGVSGKAAERLGKLLGFDCRIVSDAPEVDAVSVTAGIPLIVASPGVKPLSSPLWQAAKQRAQRGECEFISELEFGYRQLPAESRILAITGTNGKTTTTELTAHILNAAGIPARFAGNIGVPLADVAADMLEKKTPANTVCVVEVSSFQLELTERFKPFTGALINLQSDHEDRYAGGFEEYCRVKRELLKNVPPENRVYGRSMNENWMPRTEIIGDELHLDGGAVVELSRTKLDAHHNRENLQVAVELCSRLVALNPENLAEALISFTPGRHRIERVAELDGIVYVNDSKATNPASVIAALRSFPEKDAPYIVLLLGGLDKGMDFSPLAGFETRIKHVIFYGECASKIHEILGELYEHTLCGMDFREVMNTAKEHAVPGDVVLLSPACASMDMFKNYEERGNTFASLAKGL